jgi:hypothetical protein
MYDIIIYGIIIIIVVRFFYIHAKYPFWSHMPISYVQKYPLRHKYTNPLLIKTILFDDLNDTYLKYFVELLQIGYVADDSILYTMQQKNMRAYLTGHNGPTLVSFYCNPIYKSIHSGPAVQVDLEPEPVGCVASYPVTMRSNLGTVSLNYITYLSAKQEKVKYELIGTHDYNARKALFANASIVKVDGSVDTGTQPLISFNTCTWTIPRYLFKVTEIVQIYKQNWAFALDLLEEVHQLYDVVIKIDVGAIRARIDAEEWFVYAFVVKGHTMAMYFIENAHMLYETNNAKTLRLVASINNGLSLDKFNAGFQDCLRRIVKMNLDYKMITMDCIGDNANIVLGQPLEQRSNAYYLINHCGINASSAVVII